MRSAAIRIQELNPAKLASLYRQEFELCQVKKGDSARAASTSRRPSRRPMRWKRTSTSCA